LQKRFRRVRPHKNVAEVKTQEAIRKLGWTLLSHPSYTPDLALSDFHLFGALKIPSVGKALEVMKKSRKNKNVAVRTKCNLVKEGDR
jgi:hypothetical protein